MKLLHILPLLILSSLFIGCASSGGGESTASDSKAPTTTEEASGTMGTKTAYDGATGSGLLMERYKAGQIEGYRD